MRPLAGSFVDVVGNGSRVIVGIDEEALQNQDLSLPPIDQTINLLALLVGLGLVGLALRRRKVMR
jgi:hypothetical protein